MDSTESELELVVCWEDELRTYPLPRQGDVTIGRAEHNQIRLDYPAVSRHHARLRVGQRLFVEDLGGANGTLLREANRSTAGDETLGLRQLVGQSAEIVVGDAIVLGAVTLVLRRRSQVASYWRTDADAPTSSLPVVRSAAVRNVYDQAERAAEATIAVLILGETGVGKEILARAIHQRSPRRTRPFIAINCAALSETLIEAELFGHEKGAFTGALAARAGLFEAADGGTMFLDELGEMPLSVQAKLLRVLAEGAVMRLGSQVLRRVDVRFIAATNRDLSQSVAAGRFRKDLYFRLNALSLTLPPLRERLEEIEPLAHTFLARMCAQLERRSLVSLPHEVMTLLHRYSWPGNVRELRNVIERAVVLSNHASLSAADLPAALLAEVHGAAKASALAAPGAQSESAQPAVDLEEPAQSRSMRDEIRSLERARILSALNQCGGNQTQAAKLLGISRRTLTTRLAEFGLPRPRKPRDARR